MKEKDYRNMLIAENEPTIGFVIERTAPTTVQLTFYYKSSNLTDLDCTLVADNIDIEYVSYPEDIDIFNFEICDIIKNSNLSKSTDYKIRTDLFSYVFEKPLDSVINDMYDNCDPKSAGIMFDEIYDNIEKTN